MFDFAEQTKNMTAAEILNYYRNSYYAEAQVTERGIVANAINELLPNIANTVDAVPAVRCEKCKNCAMVIDLIGDPHLFCELSKNKAEVQFGDFCSYGERKEQ